MLSLHACCLKVVLYITLIKQCMRAHLCYQSQAIPQQKLHLDLLSMKAGQLLEWSFAKVQPRMEKVLNAHVLEDRRELRAHRSGQPDCKPSTDGGNRCDRCRI